MEKHKFFTLIGSILIFFWFSSFIFVSLISDTFGRLIDGFILLYVIVAFFVFKIWELKVSKISFFVFLSFFLLILFSALKDYYLGWHNNYTLELYFKTIYYSFISFLFSYTFYVVLSGKDELFSLFSKILVYLTSFFSVLFFIYFLSLGWKVGSSLIYMSFGEHYQGLSRIFGLFFIILFFLRKYLNILLFILSISLCLILIFSFNSFGVFFSLLVVIVYWLTRIFNIKTVVSFGILFLSLYFIVNNSNLMDLDLINDLINRGSGKLDDGAIQDSRSWLLSKSIELWLLNSLNFIFGPGPIQYACYVGYCESYRHPHNSIMLLITWFGLFAIPYIVFLIFSCFIILKNYLYFTKVEIVFISSLTLYYLLLSLIGGDIEQSRFLVFLTPFVYYFFRKNGLKS